MRKLTMLLMFAGVCTFAWSQNFTKLQAEIESAPSFELLKSNANEIVISLQVNSYALNRVETPRGTAVVVNAPESGKLMNEGYPDLPLLSTSIIIEDASMYQTEIIYQDYIEIDNISVAPSKGSLSRNINPDDVPFTYSEAYQTDAFYPSQLSKISDPFILRDFRGTSLQVFPYAYNPVSKVLRIYTKIVIKLTKTNNIQAINTFSRSKSAEYVNGAYNEIYKDIFLNYSNNPFKYTPLEESSPGNILIISDPDYIDTMQDYVDWKTEKGYDVEMIETSTAGSNANQIKSYVENYYNTNGLTYLLLVGDAEDIPPMIQGGNDSDNAFAYIIGSDGYSDFFVGRFSASSTADVATQVARTIYYEKEINETATWLENSFGSASNEGGGSQGHDGGESDETHMTYLQNDLEAYGYTTTTINQNGGNNAQISTAMNSGMGIANYIGHGGDFEWVNTSFSNSNVNALSNVNKLPFIFSVACVNGNFSGQTCFAEAWMRAQNGGEPTGAIGFLGSTINQAWNEPMTGQDEMVDIIIESYEDNIKRTFAGIAMNGIFLMIQEGGQGQETADTWTVFGDPSLMVRTKTPEDMTITHYNILSVGEEQFTVNCNIEGGLVGLSKITPQGVELIGRGYVESGSAIIEINSFTEPDNMLITVTAYNKITYQSEIMVIVPDGAYITWNSYDINDTEGNNNGLADYNETIKLNVTAKNVGVETANGVNCTISNSNEDINIITNEATFGDMAPDDEIVVNDAYTIEIADGVEDQRSFMFNADFTDEDDNSWTSAFNIITNAPNISLQYLSIDDTELGDGDGLLSAGETVDIIIKANNNGHAISENGIANIIVNNNGSAIYNTSDCNALEQGSWQNLSFRVMVDELCPTGEALSCTFSINLGAYSASLELLLPVGIQVEDWESGTLDSYEWDNDDNLPWAIDDDVKYEGDNSLRSGNVTSSGGESTLTIILNVIANDEVSFMKKVSCEPTSWGVYYDYLAFYIDNQMEDQWAGEINWTEENYNVSEGEHELKWTFAKDNYLDQGDDCAWIDYIILPPHSVATSIFNTQAEVSILQTSLSPNPADAYAQLHMLLPEDTKVSCEIYSITGKHIKTVFSSRKIKAGENTISFITSDLSEGYYIVVINTETDIISKKLSINR